MNFPQEPWRTLDIAPTGDAREVRRAYARLLKTIDVEAEPDRFVALRHAFEQATELAETLGATRAELLETVAPMVDDARWSAPDPSKVMVATEDPAPPAPPQDAVPRDSIQQQLADSTNRHAEALERLLLSHQNDWIAPSADEADAMLGHWAAIAADPRLEELGYYTQAEAWIAELVARGCPFSDPLVPIVAERFGWIANAALLGQSPAVRYVLDRHATLAFLQNIGQKSHPLHAAWKELNRPASEKSRRGWGTNRKSVAALLTLIRQHHPSIERQLDGWRVGLWENPQPKMAWSGLGIGLFIAFQALRLFSAPSQPPQDTPPVSIAADALTQPEPDIDRVLKILSHDHVDAKQVRERNPGLYDEMSVRWQRTKTDGKNIWDLQADISEMTTARFERVYRKAPYDEIKKFREQELEQSLYFKDIGAETCNDFMNGHMPQSQRLPEGLVDRRRDTVFDILLDAGADRPGFTDSGKFSLPASAVKLAADKANLNLKDFELSMSSKSAPNRCDGRIGLLRAALALPPKQGLKLLQDM